METVIQAEIEKSQTHLPEPNFDVLYVMADGIMFNSRDEQWNEV